MTKKCERCGKEYSRPQTYSKGQWEKRRFCSGKCAAKKKDINISKLIELYNSELSSNEVAVLVGCSGAHVLRLLKANNVAVRESGVYQKINSNKPEVKAKIAATSKGRRLPESAKEKLRSITGENHPSWKGGKTTGAYPQYTASRANGGNAGRCIHRIVAEQMLGRPLAKGEVVHHIDRNKYNNAPENLAVMTASEHAKLHKEDRDNGRKFKRCNVTRECV